MNEDLTSLKEAVEGLILLQEARVMAVKRWQAKEWRRCAEKLIRLGGVSGGAAVIVRGVFARARKLRP